MFAHVGVVAGWLSAPYELKAFVLEDILYVEDVCPDYNMSVHVDDLIGSSQGDCASSAVSSLYKGAYNLRMRLNDAGVQFSDEKSVVLASCDQALTSLRKAFGKFAGPECTSSRRLGIDHTLTPFEEVCTEDFVFLSVPVGSVDFAV